MGENVTDRALLTTATLTLKYKLYAIRFFVCHFFYRLREIGGKVNLKTYHHPTDDSSFISLFFHHQKCYAKCVMYTICIVKSKMLYKKHSIKKSPDIPYAYKNTYNMDTIWRGREVRERGREMMTLVINIKKCTQFKMTKNE